jgi:hypothetical protein
MVQLLRWDLETDRVEEGQWLKGRIYERRCDLSPSGELFVYFAMDYKRAKAWNQATWTAVSRPPYLTALTLWFKGDAWSGGGLFSSDHKLLLNEGGISHVPGETRQRLPIKVGKLRLGMGEDDPIESKRRSRDGWVIVQHLRTSRTLVTGYVTEQPQIERCGMGGLVLEEQYRISGYKSLRAFAILGSAEPPSLVGVEQAEWDRPRGRLLFAKKGCLWSWSPGHEVQMICDLSPNTFTAMAPPDWALTWDQRR